MNTQNKLIGCLLLCMLVGGPFMGLLAISIPTVVGIQSAEANSLQPNYLVVHGTDITSLSNTVRSGDDVGFDPLENITGVTLENFSLTNGHIFQVYQKVPYILSFTMNNVSLSGDLTINGSPTITANEVNVSNTFESLSYGLGFTIGSPNLALNNVNATEIRFRMSGGTFSWNHSMTTALTLLGFHTAVIQSSVITGALTVGGTGNITILDCTYGSIIETVKPTLVVASSTYNVPYNFVFQQSADVTIYWAAYDNVQGPTFTLQTNLTIYKNGQFVETISDVAGNSRQLKIDTAAAYYEIVISVKDLQGNISTETVTIVTSPSLLWFILMIVIIAGAAIGIVFLLYWRKQHQWQKTALVEIPT